MAWPPVQFVADSILLDAAYIKRSVSAEIDRLLEESLQEVERARDAWREGDETVVSREAG